MVNRETLARVDALWLVALLSFGPLLYIHGTHLWERPHFQFFPIAWGAYAYLIYTRGSLCKVESPTRRVAAVILAAISLIIGGISVWLLSPWLASVGAIFVVFSWTLYRLGNTPWVRLVSWSLLLWVTVPLPMNMDSTLIQKLQWISAASASEFLDFAGMPHLRLGNTLEVQGKKLLVDEACSGVDSLYSLFAVCILLINWHARPFVIGCGMLISVPVWAWLGNFCRLVAIAVSHYWLDVDLSTGWPHTVLGLILFSLSFLWLWLTVSALDALFQRFPTRIKPGEGRGLYSLYNQLVCWPGTAPRIAGDADQYFSPVGKKSKVDIQEHKSEHTGPDWLVSVLYVLASLFLLLGVAAGVQVSRQSTLVLHPEFSASVLSAALQEDKFPLTVEGATRSDFRTVKRPSTSFEGEHSAIWKYKHATGNLVISLDFPFRGFHELWKCYQGSGYELVSPPQEVGAKFSGLPDAQGNRITWPVYRVVFVNDLGEYAYLWFSMMKQDIESSGRVDTGIEGRLNRYVGDITFQYQLFLETGDELTSTDELSIMRLYASGAHRALDIIDILNSSIPTGKSP